MIAHLKRLRSRCAHSEDFSSLRICGCTCLMLSMRMARPSAYVVVLQVIGEVYVIDILAIGGGGLQK